MKLLGKRKYLLFLGAGVSMLGVLVAAFCTAAWFAIDSQNVSFSNTASSTNLTIDNSNVTGYKHVPTLGADGFPDYLSTTAVSKKGTTYETINNNQDTADTNFDVPKEGLGYYLLQENGKTYKYKSGYYWKFKEVEESGVKYLTTGTINKTFNVGDKFIVKHYSYNPSKYETTNTRTKLVKDSGNITVDEYNSETNPNPSYEITVTTQSSYKAWLYLPASDSDPRKVSFEKITSVTSYNQVTPSNSLFNSGNVKIASKKNGLRPNTHTRGAVIPLNYTNLSLDTTKAYFVWGWNDSTWGNIKSRGVHVWGVTDWSDTLGNLTNISGLGYIYEFTPNSTTGFTIRFKQGEKEWEGNWEVSVSAGNAYIFDNIGNYVYDGKQTNLGGSSKPLAGSTGTTRVYLYDKNGSSSFYGATPNVYAWNSASTVWPVNNNWPGIAMTKVRDYFYYADIPTNYNKLIFNGNSAQSSNLDIPTGTSNAWKATAAQAGSWYNPDTWKDGATSTFTVYLYDPSNLLSLSSSVPYAHLYDSKYQYNSKASYPGSPMTAASTTYGGNTPQYSGRLHKISFYSSFTGVIFNDGKEGSDNNRKQTVDIKISSSTHNNKIYVLTGGSGQSLTGEWYSELPDYSDTYTFYYFDNRAAGGTGVWATPHAYVWDSNHISNGTYTTTNDIKDMYQAEITPWSAGGIAMDSLDPTAAASLNVDAAYVHFVTVSSTYDSIIFTNGSTTGDYTQTIDYSSISSHDEEFFVITGTDSSSKKVTGEWHASIYSVEYYATWWIDGNIQLSINNRTAHLFDGTIMSPSFTSYTFGVEGFRVPASVSSNVPSSKTQTDGVNGIVYHFSRADSNFYKDEQCSQTFTNGNTLPLTSGTGKLYVKYNVSSSRLKQIYVDDTSWNGENLAVKDSSNTSTYFTFNGGSTFKVADGLYRITLMDNWKFQLSSGSHTNYNLTDIGKNNHTGIPDMATVDPLDEDKADKTYYRNERPYLYIKSSGAGSNWTWASFASDSTSTGVYVQIYDTSTSQFKNIEQDGNPVELVKGDGTGNDYILETGLVLTQGDIIRVYDSNTSTGYGFSSYVPGNIAKHQYVKTGQSGDGITISNLGSGGTQERFNFYLTHAASPENRMLSIAMVPLFGNGYYIMNYDSTMTTHNYFNAKKMDSAETSASYDGWYCDNTSVGIFIKSYLNGVDKIVDSMTTNSATYIDIHEVPDDEDRFYITFKETGHYNIRVDGTKVDVSEYFVNDFFSLNRLDSSLVTGDDNAAKQQEIWRQKTAIVLEVPFTANNTFNTSISIRVNCSASFIGVRSAVYTSKQPNPYNLMHGTDSSTYTTSYLTAANAATALTPDNKTTINANTSTTLYAYIIIDYRYTVTSSDLVGATPELSFYIQLTQI